MGGDFIGRWRAGSGRRTARQAKNGQYSAKVLACGSLLLSCVIVAGMATQTALAEIAAPAATRVADNAKEQGGPGVAQASRTQKSEPETVLRQPEVQKPAPEAAVQMPEARKSSHEAKDLPVPQLVLPGDLAKKIGQKIWLNETGGKIDAITSWSANEEFASLGIGHFIWFPVGKWLPFEESFPALLEFMRKKNVQFARLAGPDANSGQPVDKPGRVQEELQLTADERVEAVSARHRGGADAIHGGAGARCDGEDPQDDARRHGARTYRHPVHARHSRLREFLSADRLHQLQGRGHQPERSRHEQRDRAAAGLGSQAGAAQDER